VSGYGWLISRIDWEQLQFHHRIGNDVVFASTMLRDNYRANWARVKNSKDDYSRVEAAGKWLALYRDSPFCLESIR
jgi:hypothetical protein